MPPRFSKIKLNKTYIFSISSYKFGLGHKLRCEKLKKNLVKKKHSVQHINLEIKKKNFEKEKKKFFEKIFFFQRQHNSIIVLDLTNKNFIKKRDIQLFKKNFSLANNKNIFIIDDPNSINLSLKLKLKNINYIYPYDLTLGQKKKLKNIPKKVIGFKYFIYNESNNKILNTKKIKEKNILITLGGSDLKHKTQYICNLIQDLKLSSKYKVKIILGKYLKKNYKKVIKRISNKNNFRILNFKKNINFQNINYLITNSGLTKYEALFNTTNIIVFSDTKESFKMDKVFSLKYMQSVFSYKKNYLRDRNRLKNILSKDKKKRPKRYNFNYLYKFIVSSE